MVNPLEGVLHARYQGPRIDAGTNNYGDQEFGSPCPPPLIFGKSENPDTSHVKDVSRGTMRYFDSNIYLGGRTLAGPTTGGGMAGVSEGSNINKQAVNRVVSFMQKTYALIGSGIHEYTDGAPFETAWSLSLELTGKLENESNSIGLYPVFTHSNKPYLITAYNTTGSTWVAKRLNGDTKVWEDGASFSLVDPNDVDGGILTECQHKGRIYFLTSSTTSYFWYDFLNDSFGSAAWGATVRHPMELCSFMGGLFAVNKDISGNINIYNMNEGGTPTLVTNFPRQGSFPWGTQNQSLSNGNDFEGRPLMFVDNVYDSKLNNLSPVMYVSYMCHAANPRPDIATESSQGFHHMAFRSDGDGGLVAQNTQGAALGPRANPFKCNQNQEGSWVFTLVPITGPSIKDEKIVCRTYVDQKTRDVNLSGKTAIVIGTRFKGWACDGLVTPGVGGGGDFTNQFYHEFVGSGNTDGGAHPAQPNTGGGSHAWKFVGYPFKGTRHRAAPHERLGGGSRHHILDGSNNRIADIVYRGTDTTDADGIIRIKYSIIPSIANPSGSTVDVRWFYDGNQHAPEDVCTLVGTSHGAIIGGIADNVTVDPSVEYYVDWDAKGDGLTFGARLYLNGMIIVNSPAVGPISSPSGIGGLISWFEADDSATVSVSGSDVFQWQDKGGVSGIPITGLVQNVGSAQPLLVAAANNGLDGIRFTGASSEFLFSSSGSPIADNDPVTICVIYEPNSLTSVDTMFSISEDVPATGTMAVSQDFMSASVVAGGTEDLRLETQDLQRVEQAIGPRTMVLPSGGETGKARLLMWNEIAFESQSEIHPSGATDITDVSVDGFAESSGLINMTFGRFSGAQISGVYGSAGQYYDGTLYEVAVYNKNLNEVERDAFRVYAENKYTLTA